MLLTHAPGDACHTLLAGGEVTGSVATLSVGASVLQVGRFHLAEFPNCEVLDWMDVSTIGKSARGAVCI
jgi:hypothetical protein